MTTPYPTIRLKVSQAPQLKCRVTPVFPANVVATDGITVTKANGTYTFTLSLGGFARVGSVPDTSLSAFPFYDSVTGATNLITYDNLATEISGSLGHALTKTDDTNVTLTLGGTPTTALLQATSITVGWTGTLAATRGGTAQSTYATGDTLYSSAANTLSKLSGNITTTRKFLRQTGDGALSAAPAWDTVVAADVPGSALTRTSDTNVTLTLGGSPTTALLNAASITAGWTGTLAVARGGIGQGTANGTALDNISGFASTGILVRTGAGTYAFRTLTAPAAGITVTNGDGVSGNQTLVLANDLAALEGLGSTGIAVRTTTDTWAQRTITGTAAEITVTNGDGVSGNPTLSIPASVTLTGKTLTGGTFASPGLSGTVTGANTIPLSILAQSAAYSLLGNTTGSTANNTAFTIGGLTLKASPASSDIVLLQDEAASHALKYTTVSALASAGSVASLNGQTGAVVVDYVSSGLCLTLTSGTPVTEGDVTAAGTIYCEPGTIQLFDGSSTWAGYQSAELSLALDSTLSHTGCHPANANFHVFEALNSGSPVIGTGPMWQKTATVTMTIASPAVVTWNAHNMLAGTPVVFSTTIALPTGVTAGTTYYVIAAGLAANTFEFSATLAGSAVNTSGSQSGTHTGVGGDPASEGTGSGTCELENYQGRFVNKNTMTLRFGSSSGNTISVPARQARLIGGFRTVAAGQTEDSIARRFVWNFFNPCPRHLRRLEATASWTYSTATWRQANGSTSNHIEIFQGVAGRATHIEVQASGTNSTTTARSINVGIGIDSTTADSSQFHAVCNANSNAAAIPTFCTYDGFLGKGYHNIAWLEIGAGTDTQTWYGAFGTAIQNGMLARFVQ